MLKAKILQAATNSGQIYADDVFSTYLYTGNGSTQTINNGIDLAGKGGLVWIKQRSGTTNHILYDTVRGVGNNLSSNTMDAQGSSFGLSAFNVDGFTGSGGFDFNVSGGSFASWTFRKAPKFFDVVTHTGNGQAGRQIPHSLGVAPGMIIDKATSQASEWIVYHRSLGAAQYLQLHSTAAAQTSTIAWGNTEPTNAAFTVDPGFTNISRRNYVAYLFASLPGISKVGSYTGNGTSQTINCGFTTGARFILIKSADSTGAWYVWDSARGIIAANDPHLSLNTTAAEVTTDDSVDPDTAGFIVNQLAATNINVNLATYIFLAVA